MKRGSLFVCAVISAVFVMGVSAFAVEVYFEHTEREQLSRGVVYEQTRMMTSRGMLDVHALVVNLREPHVTLAPVASSRELSLRETTSRLLSDAGAIGGVNADFFTMARLHSAYYGPMVRNGQVLSLNAITNAYSHDLATFFLDRNNNPFFLYMRTTMRLYANGVRRMNIAAYNSVGGGLTAPVIISRTAMYTTEELDERIQNIVKIVVINDFVSYISRPGQIVTVPENGFVVLVPGTAIQYHQMFFPVGAHVRFDVQTDLNVDFSSINAAIGGGSIILRNGVLVPDVGIQPNSRHPRTAIGATHDGRMILMTVDGRTHSIGVTHSELGAILQRRGVVNAMHMDGGGSTTMVTRSPHGVYSVANTLSDGSQRRVTNALGIFDNSPVGQKTGIVLEMAETRAIHGVPVAGTVFGVDTWGNRIPLGAEQPTRTPAFVSVPADGFWMDGRYTPLRTGFHMLRVNYGEFSTTSSIYVYSLGELQPRQDIVRTLEGHRTRLAFSGIATDGTQVNIPDVTFLTVSPSYLGRFENGYFVAERGGTGYIAAAVGTVRTYIPVTVGGFPWPVNMFTGTLNFLSVPPEYVTTRVSKVAVEDIPIVRLEYRFAITAQTQASYATFYPPLQLHGEPVALRMNVYGDESGHWLRGRVLDGAGTFHNIDFARNVDFRGWQSVTAHLPSAPAPFTLDRLYMVTLEALAPTHSVVFLHGLEALYAPNHMIPVPRGTVFADNLRAAHGFMGVPGGTFNEFVIPRAEDQVTFAVSGISNFAIATMSARGGGIQSANIEQWRDFMPRLRAFPQQNVIILLDESPKNFTRRMEYELFHLAMRELREQGRTVFVVSATAEETTLTMRDNIRYINVAQNETAASSIRFWADANRVWWSD